MNWKNDLEKANSCPPDRLTCSSNFQPIYVGDKVIPIKVNTTYFDPASTRVVAGFWRASKYSNYVAVLDNGSRVHAYDLVKITKCMYFVFFINNTKDIIDNTVKYVRYTLRSLFNKEHQ